MDMLQIATYGLGGTFGLGLLASLTGMVREREETARERDAAPAAAPASVHDPSKDHANGAVDDAPSRYTVAGQAYDLLAGGFLGALLAPVLAVFAVMNANLTAEGFSALLGKSADVVGEAFGLSVTDLFMLGLSLTLSIILVGAASAEKAFDWARRAGLTLAGVGLIGLDVMLGYLRGCEVAAEMGRDVNLVASISAGQAFLYAIVELTCGKLVINGLLLPLLRLIVLVATAPVRWLTGRVGKSEQRVVGPLIARIDRDLFDPIRRLDELPGGLWRLIKGRRTGISAVMVVLAALAGPSHAFDLHLPSKPTPLTVLLAIDNSASLRAQEFTQYADAIRPILSTLREGDCVEVVALDPPGQPHNECLNGRRPAVRNQVRAIDEYVQRIAISRNQRGTSDIGGLLSHAVEAIHIREGLGERRQYVVVLLSDGMPTGPQTRNPSGVGSPAAGTRLVAIGVGLGASETIRKLARERGYDLSLASIIPMAHVAGVIRSTPALLGRRVDSSIAALWQTDSRETRR